MSEDANTETIGLCTVFDCTRCGWCCEGKGGIVVSGRDRERLGAYLDLSPEEFEQRWCEQRGGKLHVRASENGVCAFFMPGKGCAVHAAKPDICRAWPFFRGNLVDEDSYALAKEFCPGLVRDQKHEAFVREGLKYLQNEQLVGRGGPDEAEALQIRDLLEKIAQTTGKL